MPPTKNAIPTSSYGNGWLMASRPAIRRSAFGLLSGVGVLLLYFAWLQRAGPGTTCRQTATASGCDQHLNPGFVVFQRRRGYNLLAAGSSLRLPPASRRL
jgi:hypothetical protein